MSFVWISAAGLCGATLIGSLLGFLIKELPHMWNDATLGYCAGVMLAAATLGLIVPAFDMVEPIAALRFLAVDHEIVEKIVMSGAFPNLRMHNNRAIEPGHFKRTGRAGKLYHLVMPDDHIVPPRVFHIALKQNAKGPVVPKTVQTAVNFARLKQKAASFAKRDQFFHPHRFYSLLYLGLTSGRKTGLYPNVFSFVR